MFRSIFCTYFSRILWFLRTNAITVFWYVHDLRPFAVVVQKPFKGLNGRFDASLTALTKRSPTVHVFFAFYVIAFDTGYGAKVYYLVYCVTKRFYFKKISYKYSIAL